MNTKSPLTPSDAITQYIDGFSQSDNDKLAGLFGERTLLELPLVKPTRLVGRDEICRAHAEIFTNVATATFTATHGPCEQAQAAIWVGELAVTRIDKSRQSHRVAMVATTTEGKLDRLTIHLNARNTRRWADASIL